MPQSLSFTHVGGAFGAVEATAVLVCPRPEGAYILTTVDFDSQSYSGQLRFLPVDAPPDGKPVELGRQEYELGEGSEELGFTDALSFDQARERLVAWATGLVAGRAVVEGLTQFTKFLIKPDHRATS